MTNLGAAVNEAVTLGATVVSNSWGGSVTRSDPAYDATYFDHPGSRSPRARATAGTGPSTPRRRAT